MGKLSRPRHGTLQFWPRKRARRSMPRVNWSQVSGKGVLGFIAYKAGMGTAIVKDNTDKSMTSGKKISMPVTILEAPAMKVYSVRFYKSGKVLKEIVVAKADKNLSRALPVPKQQGKLEAPADFDDIRLIVYSIPSQTSIKKTPDVAEIGISEENKLALATSLQDKEITIRDFNSLLVDARGVTTGYGFTGTIKRYGLKLKDHKSEKGVRRPGSLAPWHPARVTFHTPQAGQHGMHNRIIYNLPILGSNNIKENNINKGTGFKNYGLVKSSYIIIKGSVQGPAKRPVLLTPSFRPTKKQSKLKYQLMELLV